MSTLFDLSGLSLELRTEIESSPRWTKFFSSKPKALLGVDSNAKTVKGQAMGFFTAILYLSPADISGVNLCPMAKLAGCEQACLASAGRGAFRSVFMARLRKTLFFLQYQSEFLALLRKEIAKLSAKYGSQLLVRLNGTSDIPFENVIIETLGHNVFLEFPDVQFYDYTKHPSRNLEGKTAGNYDLTYSFSALTPRVTSEKGLTNPWNKRTAVVFHRREDIPQSFRGWPVVDGDDTDVRHIEPERVVVALYAKGKAKHDTGPFVQRMGRDYPVIALHAA